MKILIYGAGIQGSYLAHVLIQNKQNDVFMLARGKRKMALDEHGLRLNHIVQRKTTTDFIKTVSSLQKEDYYDLIFVTMKYNDLDAITEIIAANSSRTIIFVGNQMDTESLKTRITQQDPQKNIFFGFQNTGGIKAADSIKILRFNSGKMKINTLSSDIETNQLLHQIFKNTSYKWRSYPSLDTWLKSHAALIMVLNSLDYLYDNQAKKIKQSSAMLTVTANAFKEAFTILEANDYPIIPKSQKKLFGHVTFTKILLKTIYSTPIMNSAQGDYEEIKQIADSFYQFKNRAGITTPSLDYLIDQATSKQKASSASLNSF